MVTPDFFIPGALKCGTSSLHFWLSQHPELCLSRASEPNFFSKRCRCKQDEESYELQFSHRTQGQLLGESSTSYLYSRKACERIALASPGAKFIIQLRDPVDATYSLYHHLSRELRLPPLDQLLDQYLLGAPPNKSGLDFSLFMYAEQIDRYEKAFGRESLLLLRFEDTVRDPKAALRNICDFLGVSPLESLNLSPKNQAYTYRKLPHSIFASIMMLRSKKLIPLHFLPSTLKTIGWKSYDLLTKKRKQYPPMEQLTRSRLEQFHHENWMATQNKYLK